jgi:uncharacterized protein (TIGR02231 family)
MKKRFLLATAIILILPAAPLRAAELTAVAPITDVIVYPDRAEITRSVEIKVPKGTTTLVIPGLPTGIVPQSIRVSGETDNRVQISTVATELTSPETTPFVPDPKIEAEIQELLKQKPPIEDRAAMAQMQIDYYKLLLAEAPQVSDKELIRSLDPQRWDSIWTKIVAKLTQAQEAMRAPRGELQAIDDRVIELRQSQRPSQPPQIVLPTMAAHIGVDADQPATARLRVTYQLTGISWQPFYHARLDSGKGEVELIQFAEVRQQSGEDWRGVSLTLSTARPALGAELPELTAWRIQRNELVEKFELSRSALGEASGQDDGLLALAPAVAQVAGSDFAAEYRIPGKIDLVSGNDLKRVVIAEHDLKSRLAARVVPKAALQAHLYASAEYGGADPLLPGPLTVFRDGALLGNSTLPLLRPQEEFRLGFGVDEKIRIESREIPIDPKSAGLFGDKRRIERQYVTKIANYHRQPLEITLLDQLPVSSSEDITVELLPDTTTPSEKNWRDQDGVLAWTGTYAPAEEKTITFGYSITAPEDVRIGGL